MTSIKSLKNILGILCVMVFLVFVSYYFIYREVRFRDETYQTILRDLSLQDTKQGYLVSTQKTVESLVSDINQINNSIISKEGEVEFIESLEATAKESGLVIEIDSLSLENNEKLSSDSIDILSVKAKTRGSWAANYLFLSRLESLPFKVKIKKFGLSNSVAEVVSGKKIIRTSVWQSVFEIDILKYK